MNILILGPEKEKLNYFFHNSGDTIFYFKKELDSQSQILDSVDFIISYGYRYIINKEIINRFCHRIINLHISYLPWNKGADPNFWSFLEDTPKGVTIHYIDEGLDTGDIIVRKEIPVYADDTLETTYIRLKESIEHLLTEYWDDIKKENIQSTPQPENIGSYHRSKDKQKYSYLLLNGWKTPIKNLIGKAIEKE